MSANRTPDLTVTVGLDAATLQQWRISLPTIAKYRSRLFKCPWLIFYDWEQVVADQIIQTIESTGLDKSPHIKLVAWPEEEDGFASQRAKMLTGFVFLPAEHVRTDWTMKIDTDAIALHEGKKWLWDDWFDGDYVLVAPKWGYSKPKGDNRTAIEWAESLESFGDKVFAGTPRINLVEKVDGNKISHGRFCSWVSYYRTAWLREMSWLLDEHCGRRKMPVPSQDTVHWYMSERGRYKTKIVNMKKFGWTNCPRIKTLREQAGKALDGEYE
jgi:hypothetical protein